MEGTSIHNASALEEGKTGNQGRSYAINLIGVRHSLVCEELVAMVDYPQVGATMKRLTLRGGYVIQ